jgi:hypothetical protein
MSDLNPTSWRERAEQLRELAMAALDPVEQETLFMLAADCEEIGAKESAADRA